jgi:hypothetical protein
VELGERSIPKIGNWDNTGHLEGCSAAPRAHKKTRPPAEAQVVGHLLMDSDDQNKASFKDVDLSNAKVTGKIDMVGASFGGTLNAENLHVGEMLVMRTEGENKASFKDVDLSSARITGQIDMTGASFDGTLDASYLQVGDDLILIDAHYARPVVMVFAHIGGNLNLAGATLAGLYLSGASIAGDLTLGGPPFKSAGNPPRADATTGTPLICASVATRPYASSHILGARRILHLP